MTILETSEVTGLIIDWTAKAIKEKLDRNETVIRILIKLGLDPDHPSADFTGVYNYALVEYGIGKPRPVLELFRSNEIQKAFRSAFEKNNPSVLQAEAKSFLAAFKIGDDIREFGIDIFKEFDLFSSAFHKVTDRTRKPAEVKRDLKLDGLSEKLDKLIEKSSQTRKRSSPPFVLPQLDLAYFTGRDSELQQLEKLLLSEKGPKVAGIAGLTGTGGMGKSALAFHFAHKYRQRFPDGVIGLRVDGKSLETVAQRFASLAGVEINPEEGRSAAEIMQSVFRDQRALLIFDNAEDATVRALRPGGDHCAIIVTTRNRGLLLGLEIPSTAHIDLQRFDISENEALLKQLLGERAQNELDAVRDIHMLVGGLPLALRIVGGTLADQPYTTLATYNEILRHEKQRLSSLRDRDDPDLDVRASFAVSLKHLNEQELDLFACLGACVPDGFALETVQIASGLPLPEVRSGLGRLHRLSLLNQGAKENRFVLHPLLHLFARELAEEHKLMPAAEQRHTDYFVQYVNEHKGLIPAKLDAIEQELDALLLTAKRLTEKQVADYGFYLALEPFFQSRGYWQQALHLIDSFSQVAEATRNWYVVVQFLLQRGQFLQLLGKFDEAEQILRESESRTHSIEDKWQRNRSQAMVLNSLGGVLQRRGGFSEAVDAFQRSYNLLIELGDDHGQAMVLNSLGGVLQRQGRFTETADAFKRSYSITPEKLSRPRRC